MIYKIAKSIETVGEGIFIAGMIVVLGISAAIFLPSRWVYLELRDTWT